MTVLAVLLALGATDEEVAAALVGPAEKVEKAVSYRRPEGVLLAIASARQPPWVATATVALLDPKTQKVLSKASVSVDYKDPGVPSNDVKLGEPVGGVIPFELGFRTDGMGSKLRNVWFALVGTKVVKVLDLSSAPRPPTGPRGKSELMMVRALDSVSKGLPDFVETREVDTPKGASLVRKLWRFDGNKYVSRAGGDPLIHLAQSYGTRTEQGDVWYRAVQAVDGAPETAWASNDADAMVSFVLEAPTKVTGLALLAGCAPWAENPRLKKVQLRFDDEEQGPTLELADVTTEQKLPLPPRKAVSMVTLQVLEVYGDPGACISELRFLK